MAPRKTRTSKAASAQDKADTQDAAPELPASSTNPPMLFILPQDRSPDARILSLPHPASGRLTRFFYDPKSGLHEFTNISAPKSAASSWLLAPDEVYGSDTKADDSQNSLTTGYAIEQPSLLVATPIDLVLMVLPVLLARTDPSERQLYLTLDDQLEKVSEYSSDLGEILRHAETSSQLEARLATVCDTIEAGDDTMYRINVEKLAKELLRKAEKVCSQGLPASMEQKFVQEFLQIPTTTIAPALLSEELTDDTQRTVESQTSATTTDSPAIDSQESLVSNSTAATSVASTQTEATQTQASTEVAKLLRLRTAINFMLASYVGPSFHAALRSALNEGADVNFAPLDAHLKLVEEAKKEAYALRSLSDNISRKRRNEDDDEQEEIRAEKRRKKEEEDAKKKAQSRAIKQLAKADTSGMKKLSSFFTKAPAKKAA